MPWSGKELPQYDALHENLHADVAIVGGGIAGLLTAYQLTRHGLRTVVLEERRIAGGVTARTTAGISAQHGVFCERLIRDFGEHLARQYVQANLRAVEQYESLIRTQKIDCAFVRRPSYVYTSPHGPDLEREAECAAMLGAPAKLTAVERMPFSVREAVRFDRQASLSPLPFLAALLPGLTIFEHSPVRDVRGSRVLCDGGTVTAPHIVIASHYPMLERFGLYGLRLRQEQSYFLSLRGAPPIDGTYLDAAEGWSFQQSGDLLFFGGGSHRCGTDECGNYELLRERKKLWFPEAQEVCAWSSQDCHTLDGVPYIGAYSPLTPQLHVATGFGRWGMTGSMVAATILCGELLGSPSPYAEIFSPARFFPSASIEQMMEGALYALRGIGGRLFTRAELATAEIAPGHGGIVTYRGKKYGVYRHIDGTLYAVSPVCPHRKCMLSWNDDDKTWDCPCHGSRFDYTGRRLQCTPAKAALRSFPAFGKKEV